MLDFNAVSLENVVVHQVGNKIQEEKLVLSAGDLRVDEMIKELLLKFFTAPFKTEAFFQFTHESDINQNVIFYYASKIFENSSALFDYSMKIAEHLYESADHPNIKSGEFYVAYFKDIVVEDEQCDAIGLFKSENKDTYIKVFPREGVFNIEAEHGININKLDKACLIFNVEKEFGYKVCMVDKTNKTHEAQYWRDNFLGLKQRADDFYQTQNYMNVCKGFVEEIYNPEHEVEKPAQIDMLNKSAKFFKEKETFNQKEFEQEVLMGQPVVVNAFNDYKEKYKEEFDVTIQEEFEISPDAYKQSKRVFKSVLKLDKNFHVYIHGSPEMIVKGVDPTNGLNYYQLYYEKEN
jgi:hypothetical protein